MGGIHNSRGCSFWPGRMLNCWGPYPGFQGSGITYPHTARWGAIEFDGNAREGIKRVRYILPVVPRRPAWQGEHW